MTNLLQAQAMVNRTIESEPYGDCGLSLATPAQQPLQLPDGWRFPYDSFVGRYRVRHSMLILFVDRQKSMVEIEHDDFEEPEKVSNVRKILQDKQLALPPFSKVLEEVQEEHGQAQVVAFEPVLDAEAEDDEALLQWRVIIGEGTRHYAVPVYQSASEALHIGRKEELRPRGVVSDWVLGHAKYQSSSQTLTVNMVNQPASSHSQWIVWSCMARVTQFVEKWGYGGVGPHNVQVRYAASDIQTRGADFDIIRGVPTINFLRGGGWAEDLSVVLHELGHALWALLYTRPPKHLKDTPGPVLPGIQEGFADYFAATLLADDSSWDGKIGGGIPAHRARDYGLPRVVNGDPHLPVSILPDRYEIGQQWANLLWDLRTRMAQGGKNADPVILSAHIKPRVGDDGPQAPLPCYFESLQETARHLGVYFSGWNALRAKHL
jgi:hypothetical protein